MITAVLGNLVWPALCFASGYWAWWVIALGLLLELPVIVWIFQLPLGRGILADVMMNLASATLGLFLLGVAGIAWEVFPRILLYKVFNLGTFNPVTWGATLILATLINTLLEAVVLQKGFGAGLSRGRVLCLGLANAAGVTCAVLEIWRNPPQL